MTTDSFEPVKIGIVSVSDRASSGGYEDKGLPALKAWLERALKNPITFDAHLIPDEKPLISHCLLYPSYAADELLFTSLSRRRHINQTQIHLYSTM